MSTLHLTTGSVEPPRSEGKLRLYSMEFCPYAQRSRLILLVKNVPHDIVNINLENKPEWYLKLNPQGKVPALAVGSQILIESLDICEYLDEKYPNPPLYPKDPEAKKRDKELIEKIGPLTSVFYKCIAGTEEKTPDEWAKEFTPVLEVFEKELALRGTTYFGGDKPGMVDYMLWPWGERAGVVPLKLGQQLPLGADQLPAMRKWRKSMRDDSVCSQIYHGPEKHWKFIERKIKKLPADYDNL